jgi:hypothetical protein
MAPIIGTWSNSADKRCNGKAAYPSMAIAEEKARKASARAGRLIISYTCYDCGCFHIGRADESQKLVRQQEVRQKHRPKCILCGEIMHVRADCFDPNPDGPVCGTKRCKRRRARRRKAARRSGSREAD